MDDKIYKIFMITVLFVVCLSVYQLNNRVEKLENEDLVIKAPLLESKLRSYLEEKVPYEAHVVPEK